MRYLLTFILSVSAIFAQAQQVNPVTDYTFANRMSAGRSTVTDTAAYISVGPRFGAVRGLMPPIVVDTAVVNSTRRNGLLIFSVQKNKMQIWDSAGARWADLTGTAGSAITSADTAAMLLPYLRKADTTDMLLAYLRKGDTSAMLLPYLRKADTTAMLLPYLMKSDTSGMLLPYLLKSDTIAMLSPYLKESDTVWLSNRINLKVNIADTATMLSPYVRGSGTANYLPKFNASRSVTDSKLFEIGTNLLFNTTTASFTSTGISTIEANNTSASVFALKVLDTTRSYIASNSANTMDINNLRAGDIRFYTSAQLRGRFQTDGTFRLNSLTGTGSRIVTADADGVLSATSSATGLVDTLVLSTRDWRQKGDDSLGAIIATKGSGTVTSVATGYGSSGGTITTTGTIIVDSAIVASRLRVGKVVDSLSLVKQNVLTNPVTGTGTSGQVSYWNGTTTQTGENALFYDATNDRLGIGTNSPAVKLSVLENVASTSTRVIVQQLQRASSGTAANGVGGYLQLTAQDNAGAQREAGVISWDLSNVSSANPQGRLLLGSRGVNDALIINNSGNIGVATNPNNWNRSTIQIGRGSIFSTAGEISTVMNAYNDGAFKYIINSGASQFLQVNNTFQWNSADAGLPDSTFTFTRRMTLGADGELLLNTTTDAGDYKLQVSGNAYVTGTTVLAATSGEIYLGSASDQGDYRLQISGRAISYASDIGEFRVVGGNYGTNYNTYLRSNSSAQGVLQLGNNAENYIIAGNTASGGLLIFRVNGTTESVTTGTEAMRLTSAGIVSINNASPSASAQLDVSSTTRGFLPPRMTTTQRDAISSPAAGLVIYNTTTSKLQVYTTSWTDLH